MESTTPILSKRGPAEDQEMGSTTTDDNKTTTIGQRRVAKAKRRNKNDRVIDPETGEELEFEDDSDFEDEENYIDEQEVVQHDSDEDGIIVKDDDWEDEDTGKKKDKKKKKKSKKAKKDGEDAEMEEDEKAQIWNEKTRPLEEDEELDFDASAYEMLHRAAVEWPCLSIDYLLQERTSFPAENNAKEWFPSGVAGNLNPADTVFDKRLNTQIHKQDNHPMSVYFCGGSQSEQTSDNKIYVMKWSQMESTLKQDREPSDNSEDDEEDMIAKLALREPIIRFESIPHRGAVNRIRSLHGSSIVATWNAEGEVGVFNVASAVQELDKPITEVEEEALTKGQKKKKKKTQKKSYGGTKIASFRHKQEGYALEWSPSTFGRLASGSNDAMLWLYRPADESCSSFIKETQVGLQGHKGSIEDIQWSPAQEQVLATCSSDQTIKLWDLRATQMKCQMSYKASDCDINVMSWNQYSTTTFLLASGDDKGEFRIWDLRMLGAGDNGKNKEIDSITRVKWHTSAITSISFEPREESVLAVSSADNKLTLWDFSVDEEDQEAQNTDVANGMDIPPQLMFLHQGQKNMKELRFHPQYRSLILTTAEDSFNIFRPNLDPDYGENEENEEEKNDQDDSQQTPAVVNSVDWQNEDSDEDQEAEERRIMRTARQLNKQRNARSKSKQKKRTRRD